MCGNQPVSWVTKTSGFSSRATGTRPGHVGGLPNHSVRIDLSRPRLFGWRPPVWRRSYRDMSRDGKMGRLKFDLNAGRPLD